MLTVSTAILILLYALAAAITSGSMLLSQYPISPSLFSGAAVFVVAMQLHVVFVGWRLRRRLTSDVTRLRSSNAAVKAELDATRRNVADVTLALAKRTDAQERKLVTELKMLERLVREFASGTTRPTKDLSSEGASAIHVHQRPENHLRETELLGHIRSALEENRIDLHLQPVVSLPQRKIRFYEALTRLRSSDGRVIMPGQYIRVAAPAGLMSIVDNLLLFRCVQVLRRLTVRQRDVGVFCNISGHTLRDAEFFPQFLEFLHQHRDLSGQIVFEFSQGTILAMGDQEEANLRYLSSLGFGLSMDQVVSLKMDFARLRSLGLRYMKVSARTLISGMHTAHAPVAAEDLKDLLARSGISLIAERIENERSVVQLLDYNIELGQGYLFGEPKPIREHAEANDPRTSQAMTRQALPDGLNRRLAG